jgi:hypothetical protein
MDRPVGDALSPEVASTSRIYVLSTNVMPFPASSMIFALLFDYILIVKWVVQYSFDFEWSVSSLWQQKYSIMRT